MRHFIDEDTILFDIFKTHGEENNEEKSVNLNGISATANNNETHFSQIDRQLNNQINDGERNGFNLTSFDPSRKEKTYIENTGDGNMRDSNTKIVIDSKYFPFKRYLYKMKVEVIMIILIKSNSFDFHF